MSTNITYKDNIIAEITENGTRTLKTAGKYCEGDIIIENTENPEYKNAYLVQKFAGTNPKIGGNEPCEIWRNGYKVATVKGANEDVTLTLISNTSGLIANSCGIGKNVTLTIRVREGVNITTMKEFLYSYGNQVGGNNTICLDFDTSKVTNFTYSLSTDAANSYNQQVPIVAITGRPIDFTSATTVGNIFGAYGGRLTELQYIRFVPQTLKVNMAFHAPIVDIDSINSLIECLAPLGDETNKKTLQLHKKTYALLTDEHKRIIQERFWEVVTI